MKLKLLICIAVVFGVFSDGHSQCGSTFYDQGGLTGNYNNDSNYEVTYCPDVMGAAVTVTFTAFNIDALNDGLYIYSGNSSNGAQIMSPNNAGFIPGGQPGAFWGNQIPGPFTSSSPDGCLTFKFRSNNAGTAAGWVANITCAPPVPCASAPSAVTAANITSNSFAVAWAEPASATAWEVLSLPCGTPAPTATTSGIQTSVNPFVLNGLTPSMCYQVYVRSVCGPDEFSPWSGPLIVITANAPAGCGGSFFDPSGPFQNYSNNSNVTTTICPDVPGQVVTVAFNSFSTEATYDALYVYDGNSTASPQIESANSAGNVPGGLAGGFWGTDIPESFTSTSVEGCLTFRFVSDAGTTSSGWDANVICALPATTVIALHAFLDSNGNSIKDTDEPAFAHGSYTYQLNNAGNILVGTSNHTYNLNVYDPDDTYDLSFNIAPEYAPYYESSVTFNDVSVAAGSGITHFYFPIAVTAAFNDVSVDIFSVNNPQPGFISSYVVVFRNVGTTAVSGTLTFTKDPLLTMYEVSPAGAVMNANGFTHAYTGLQPFETRAFSVLMNVPTIPTVNLGTFLTNTATITGAGDDLVVENNTSTYTAMVVGSYDPNDIVESHGPRVVFSEFGTDEYLYYTIRFQNTGTANATTVRVENLLDGQLDVNSISMVTASHNYSMTRDGSQLTWLFDDIQLVPESVNSADSNGYVVYKGKPNPGYAIGDIIPSVAEIYFDYNPPIVTEPFYTEFVAALALNDPASGSIRMYPNPARSLFHVSADPMEIIDSISIYDVLGKRLETFTVGRAHVTLNVSGLSKGVYLVEINTGAKNRQVRILIIN